MKIHSTFGIVVTTVAFGVSTVLAQGLPVIDVASIAQAIRQVELAVQQVEHARVELERLGDPKLIKTPAAAALIQSLSLSGAGRTLEEIQKTATGAAGTRFDGNGLFRAPQETLRTADGQTVARVVKEYRKFDAVAQAAATLEQVMRDTQDRRQTLRQQIQSTLKALQVAQTMAEVQKLQAVLAGQNSELGAIDRERDAALSRVLVQQVYNQTDAARQQQARREEMEAGVRQATDKLGQLFKVDTSIVRIPSPVGR